MEWNEGRLSHNLIKNMRHVARANNIPIKFHLKAKADVWTSISDSITLSLELPEEYKDRVKKLLHAAYNED